MNFTFFLLILISCIYFVSCVSNDSLGTFLFNQGDDSMDEFFQDFPEVSNMNDPIFLLDEAMDSDNPSNLYSHMEHRSYNDQHFSSFYDSTILSIQEAESLPILGEIEGGSDIYWLSSIPQRQSSISSTEDNRRKRKSSSLPEDESNQEKNIDKTRSITSKIGKNFKELPLFKTVNDYFPCLNLKQQDDKKMEYEFSANTLQERKVLGSHSYLPIQYISPEDTHEFESIRISMMIVTSHSGCYVSLIANDMSFNPIPWIKEKDYKVTSETYLPLKEHEVLQHISYQLQFDDWKKELPMIIRLKLKRQYSVKGSDTSENYKIQYKMCKYDLVHSSHIFNRHSSFTMDDQKYTNKMRWINLMNVFKIYNNILATKHLPIFETVNNHFPLLNLKQQGDKKMEYEFSATTLQERKVLGSNSNLPIQYISSEDTQEFESIAILMMIVTSHSSCRVSLIANDMSFNPIPWIKEKDYKVTSETYLPLKEGEVLQHISYQLQFDNWKKELPMMIRLKISSFHNVNAKESNTPLNYKRKRKICKYELIHSKHIFDRRLSSNKDDPKYKNTIPWIYLMKVNKIYQSNLNLKNAIGKLNIANNLQIENVKAPFFLFHQDNQLLFFGLTVASDILTRRLFSKKYSVYPWEFLVNKKDNTFDSTEVSLVIASDHKDCNVQLIAFEDEVEMHHLDDEKWKKGEDYTVEDVTESNEATQYHHLLNENANTLFHLNYKLNYKSMKLDRVTDKKKSYIGVKLKGRRCIDGSDCKRKSTCKYFLLQGSQSFKTNSISSLHSLELKQQYPWIMF